MPKPVDVARQSHDSRPLLARILDTPHLARVIPLLQPEVLHRVIERCGLEDSGELVVLATPAQLTGVLDLDLWQSDRPGLDQQFNADRFGVWLEVLVEAGVGVAARTLAGIDTGLVTAALAQHVLVFDPSTLSASDDPDAPENSGGAPNATFSSEIGGYLVAARRPDAWDAIVAVLTALEATHGDTFHQLMRGCRSLSNSAPELDGLDDLLTEPEQIMFDLADARDRRRERLGYTTPAEARAFLQAARQLAITTGTAPSKHPVAAAYFLALDDAASAAEGAAADHTAYADSPLPPDDTATAVASLVGILIDDQVLPQPPRALLEGPQGSAPRLTLIHSHLQFVHDRHAAAYMARTRELAFLANTLLAGCSIQARPFTLQEASDAAVAVCNLGLEHWPARWISAPGAAGTELADGALLPEGFLVEHDLVSVFQVGWSVLHRDACLYAAERLVTVLATLTCDDRETRRGLKALRAQMKTHLKADEPWRAREAMEVLTSLDMPAWAALLGLIDECPVMHAGLTASQRPGTRAVSASAFEFISELRQIDSVRAFLQRLPETLRG